MLLGYLVPEEINARRASSIFEHALVSSEGSVLREGPAFWLIHEEMISIA